MSPRSRLLLRLARSAMVLACLAPLLALSVTAPSDAAGVYLHRGSHGPKVRLLESRLHRLRLLASSAVDGRYRQATVRAVKRFQRRHHVRVTGWVNTRTWNMIAREVARPPGPAPTIIGHRGAIRPGMPENTLESLRYAHGWAGVLEFDLRLTSDRQLVLMHDVSLNRTTNCTGPVSSWTLADLRAQCRAGDQPIPTFTEVAEYASRISEPIAPELKNQEITDADIDAFIAVLDQYQLTGRTYVQSFEAAVLQKVEARRPGIQTVLAAKQIPSVPLVKGSGASVVAVKLEDVTAARVRLYKGEGLRVWTFTALDQAGLLRARSLRANAVVTDIPRQAANLYRS